ncbi:MAG TPA: alpha-amylase family glycosyl hydrolase [Burkholderiaceae bacterium]
MILFDTPARRSTATAALATALLAAGCTTLPPGALPAVDTRHVTALDPGSTLPAGWQHGAFIEIFVRGFNDSDGDGIGDLRGLIDKLDCLRDLGIKGIWLMPVTPSADHDHGYATTDYRNIEPAYGTLADFDALLEQAHARGIGVITDDVVNHSAATHPLFVNAASGPRNRYRDWYVWQNTAPAGWDIWGKNPWTQTAHGAYFATFGAPMPDFNLKRAEVVAYHEDSLRFWLNRGLDGFRLDAVPHLIENGPQAWNDQPESRRLTHELVALIHGYAHRHVVCEATADPQAYAADDVCGSAFAFGHQYQIVKAAQGDAAAIRAVADYFTTAPAGMATMVSNHDIFAGERLWDQVGGNLAQYRLAAATYLLQPGTPYIYYGEEIGMAGVKGLPGDAPLRTPMSWTADPRTGGFTTGTPFRPASPNAATQNAAAQAADPNSLLAFYKAMLTLRNTLPPIAQGRYEAPFVSGKVMGYQRRVGTERTLVLINYDSATARIEVDGLPAGGTLLPAFPAGANRLTITPAGTARIAIAAQAVRVYLIGP